VEVELLVVLCFLVNEKKPHVDLLSSIFHPVATLSSSP
jgi:hypothetical protein